MSIAILNNENLQKLFYYSLKRTGSRENAEELTQEISLELIRYLSKGYKPVNFDGWMWTVARRKYAKWAENKRSKLDLFEGSDISDIPEIACDTSIEDDYIQIEQLQLLQRELMLLSKEYREIVVAYYIENSKISDIAKSTGLPEGTVKHRLFISRKNLKEGMKMARTYGKRSYAPENIKITKSGMDGSDGTPWTLINRSIPKNILLEAYENPCTIEELSLALGIAAPYMEEEVERLVNGTLLKKLEDGRYETDFIILSRETQSKMFDKKLEYGKMIYPFVRQIADAMNEKIEKSSDSLMAGGQTDKERLWMLLAAVCDLTRWGGLSDKIIPDNYSPRPSGGCWDITGYENWEEPFNSFIGMNGNGNDDAFFCSYKIGLYDNLWNRAGELCYNDTVTLAYILYNNRTYSELTLPEKNSVDNIVERGFAEKCCDRILPKFPVFRGDLQCFYNQTSEAIGQKFQDLEKETFRLLSQLYDEFKAIILSDVPNRLEKQVKFVSSDSLCHLRSIVLKCAVEDGDIALPEDPSKSTIAMYMRIGK